MSSEKIVPNRYEKFIATRPGTSMCIVLAGVFALTGVAVAFMPDLADSNGGFTARTDIFQERSDAFREARSNDPTSQKELYDIQEGPINQVYLLYEAREGNILTKENLEKVHRVESAILGVPGFDENCQKETNSQGNVRCKPISSILNHVYVNSSAHEEQCRAGWCNAPAAYLGTYNDFMMSSGLTLEDAQYGEAVGSADQTASFAAFGMLESCPNFIPSDPYLNATSRTPVWGDMPCQSTSYQFTDSIGSIVGDPQAYLFDSLAEAAECDDDGESTDPYTLLKTGLRTTYLSREFSCSKRKSKFLRSIIYFGGPFEVNGTIGGNDNPANIQHRKWLETDFFELVNKVVADLGHDQEDSDIRVFHIDARGHLGQLQMNQGLMMDMVLIVGSFVFVFGYVWFATNSLFLTCFGLLEILLSFPLALFCWSVLGQQKYYNTLMALGLFVILGIGADDIFVFNDAWKQSATQPKHISGSVETRLAWSYRRAVSAMTVTSATTFCAFIASAFTPIPIMLSFGVFAALLVLFDFILVITWFPACVIFHHTYILPRVTGCCGCIPLCCVPQHRQDAENLQASEAAKTGDVEQLEGPVPAGKENIVGEEDEDGPLNVSEMRATERFFYNKFAPWMKQAHVRFTIIVVFTSFMIVCGVVTGLYLRPAEESVRLFKSDEHPVTRRNDILDNEFLRGADDYKMQVEVVWGLDMAKPIDRAGVDMQESETFGKPQFDTGFDLEDSVKQLEVLDVCEKLGGNSELVPAREYYCFMEVFQEYVISTGRSFPVGDQFVPIATEPGFEDFIEENDYVGNGNRPFKRSSWFLLDEDETRVKMAWVSFNSTTPPDSLPYAEGKYWMDLWDAAVKETAGGLDTKFHNSFLWSWTVTQRYLLSSAVNGIGISFSLSFVVLLVSSGNWFISTMAIACIAGICLSVFAMMVAAGWSIGVLESICMIIVVGMSVDYTVHLIHSYNESTAVSRYGKARAALTEMGVSVLGGACTTFGASVFLFMAQMTFFYQFGLFIGMTIAFSCVFAVLYLIALVMTFGPEGKRGGGKLLFGDISILSCKKA